MGQIKPFNTVSVAERHVPLHGQPNFRDLGGYKTLDGHMVSREVIYRSGELSKLGNNDLKILERLRIRTVVDFRSDLEVKIRGPARLPNGTRVLSLPIEPVGMNSLLKPALETGDFSEIPVNYLEEAYRAIVHDATEQYSALMRTLLDPNNRPLVFHCTHGKDRSGIAAIIVLLSLGVPKETLRDDYLLSNVYREKENLRDIDRNRQLIAERNGVDANEVDMSNVEALFCLKPRYFDAAYDEILNHYGSAEAFIHDGLGIDDSQLRRLRDQLTE